MATAMSDVTASPGNSPKNETDEVSVKAANSDFLTARAPERRSARLSSALLDYKRPDGLNLVPLGTTWSVDIFVRPHNGIRRELIDLYNMIDSMQRRVQELRSADIKRFFRWWEVFASYLRTVFDLSNQVLVPWGLKGTERPNALAESVGTACGEHIEGMFGLFHTILEQMPRRPPDESLAKIIKALTHIHPIFEYLEAVENTMPEIAEANMTAKEAARMEKKVAIYVHKNGDADFRHFHLNILGRGMTEEIASAWRRRVPPILRIMTSGSKAKFANSHIGIVDKLALVD